MSGDDDPRILDQRNQIEKFCRLRGWSLIQVFTDHGFGGHTDARPAFQQMMDQARSDHHPFDFIVVSNRSRIARGIVLLDSWLEKLAVWNVSMVSVGDDDGDLAWPAVPATKIFEDYEARQKGRKSEESR
ncbi:recombinase family protein [Rhizobium sp. P32RR-XVIII]|uniref:recombinase family protein n=1 Tax=Rhizobium sp. P32RR-XVIII TaxID=2726738 RepID=UPI0039185B12